MSNREIKFRAWFDNGKAQDMFFVGDAYGTTHPLDCCRYAQDGQPITLMQYAGLKDANGVDVYEGDIVEDHNGIRFVEYAEKHAAFRVNYANGQAKWFYDYNLRCERESIQVIGNIYQNKDLLNG